MSFSYSAFFNVGLQLHAKLGKAQDYNILYLSYILYVSVIFTRMDEKRLVKILIPYGSCTPEGF